MLEIKGFEKVSLIDYPGKMASVVFLPYCNFRCPYCQNPDLIERPEEIPTINENDVLQFLENNRKKWIDGVCITGGEPTLHKDLPGFIKKLNDLEISVKLDTNGTNPEMVKDLIEKKLVDYIAMDIKAPPERYEEVCRCRVDMNLINETIRIIMNSSIDYEFRTTCPKSLISKEDIEKIGIWLKGARAYYIQQFRPGITLDPSFRNEKAYTEEELKELAEIAKPYFCKVGVRA